MNERRPAPHTVHDVELLYELSLSIGSSLELVPNCRTFIQALLARMHLDAAAVWVHDARLEDLKDGAGYSLVYACPGGPRHETRRPAGHAIAAVGRDRAARVVRAGALDFEAFAEGLGVEDGLFLLFALSDVGVLELYRAPRPAGPAPAYTGEEIDPLRPVMDTFAVSLAGSLAYRRLREEMRERKEAQQGLDITDRKRAEDALQRSEERFRELVEYASDILYRTDVEGRFTYISPAVRRLLGYDEDELIGVSYLSLIREDHREEAHAFYERQVRNGIDSTYFEIPALSRSGDTRWFGQNVRLVYEDDRVVGMQAVARDITDRRRTEEMLRTITSRLSTLIRSIQAAVLVEDEKRLIVLANQAACDLFEIPVPPELLLGVDCAKAAEELGHLFADPGFVERVDELVRDRHVVVGEVLRMKDGRILERDYIPIFLENEYRGHLWQYRDVTERRRAEDALRASETRKSAILTSALDAVITIDADARVIEFNRAAEQIFGYTQDEALGRDLAELIIPPRLREAHTPGMAPYLRMEGPVLDQRVEVTAMRADGSEFDAELGITAIHLDDRPYFTAYLRDITVRRQTEAALLHAKAEAERSARTKEEFLTNMSHEIRTPLNAVIGMAHLLQETPLTGRQVRYLNAIRFSADTLLALINDILDFAKIGADMIEFEQVPFRLDHLLQGLVDTLGYKAREKGLRLDLDFDPALPLTVAGDPARLNQILVNLLSNAVKFTETGGVLLKVAPAATIEEEAPAGDAAGEEEVRIVFAVQDTGIGIPEGAMTDIFDGFTQARSDTTRKYGGTGLGLAIVKELTERQGGRVTVQSVEGAGSTFRVVLPFRLVEADAAAEEADEDVDADLTGVRLLLVEDNEMNQLVASEMLTNWGAHVDIAGNGRLAVERLRDASYDLVLMDIQMPEMDGYEATRTIRSELGLAEDVLPIVALTASALLEQRARAREAGMNDFVTKPFAPSALRRCIARSLGLPAAHAPRAPRWPFEESPDTPPPPAPLNVPPRDAPEEEDVVDLAFLKEQARNQPAFLVKVIDLFLTQIPPYRADLEAARETADWPKARFVAHKMKASAGMLGARRLEQCLRHLEEAIDHQRDLDALPDRIGEALALLARVAGALTRIRAHYVAGDGRPSEPHPPSD